jgi:predicted transcriptional regulator
MSDSTTAAAHLRGNRIALGISQSKLARLSGVSRFKICTCELGGGTLSTDDQGRIREALKAEAERLRAVTMEVGFDEIQRLPAEETSRG